MIRTYYWNIIADGRFAYRVDIDETEIPTHKLYRAELPKSGERHDQLEVRCEASNMHWTDCLNWVLLPERYDYLIDRLLSGADNRFWRCEQNGRPRYDKIQESSATLYSIMLCMNDISVSIDDDYYLKTDTGSMHVTFDGSELLRTNSFEYVHQVWSFDVDGLSNPGEDISHILGLIAQYEQNYVNAYRTAVGNNALERSIHKAEMRSAAAAMKLLLKNLVGMYPDIDVPRVELAPPQKFGWDDVKSWLGDNVTTDIKNILKDIINE